MSDECMSEFIADLIEVIMPHNIKLFPLMFVFILFVSPLQAVAETAEEAFQRGVTAAADGDYQAALRWFTQARDQGLNQPRLEYNLGVANYRLGRLQVAREHFERLALAPGYAAIAHYNLGLIANKAGDESAAITWFRRARDEAKDSDLRRLCATALQRLGVKEKVSSSPRGFAFAYALVGYDSNVKLTSDLLPQTTGRDDTYAEVLAGGNVWLRGNSLSGLRLSLNANLQKYQDLTDYDYGQFQLVLHGYRRIARWHLRAGASWNESYLGGEKYLRTVSGELRGRYRLSDSDQLRLRYRYSNLRASNDIYDSLGGQRHQLRAGLRHGMGAHRLTAYYQVDLNDRNDRRTASSFTSTSPTRHGVRLIMDLRLAEAWRARLQGRYRFSHYNDPSDTAGGPVTREDHQWRLGGRLAYQLAKDWELESQYLYYDNRSNIDAYTYHRHLVSLGVSRYF